MECKFSNGGICGHAECPMYYEECPVPDTEGICRYEEREEDVWALTPKACLDIALKGSDIMLEQWQFDFIWADFSALMKKFGYAEDEDE